VEGSRGIADTWRRKKEFGGGMLYDWGAHLIDQILLLIQGVVTSVFMRQQHLIESDADDNFRLELEFDTGLSALVEIGTCNFIMHPLWYVLGRKGSAQIDYWDLSGKVVTLTNETIRWEDEIKPNIAGPSITMAPRAADTVAVTPLPEVAQDRSFFYKNFARALEGTEPLCVAPAQTLRVMQVIDLAFASTEQNQVLHCRL
jgi:predicted dehydrogenase